jgi:cytochrome c-type biogenesis protein CcmH
MKRDIVTHHRLSALPRAALILLILGLGLAATLFLPASPVQAQEPTPSDNEVNAVAKQLYCPVCENVPLDVCPTQACAQWRATIREKLEAGWSEREIKDYFVEQYGARVLAAPPARGLNLLVYLLPPLAFAVGAYIFYRAVRTWHRASVPAVATPPAAEDDYTRRIEDELRRRE